MHASKASAAVFAYDEATLHAREALALCDGRNDARQAHVLFCLGRLTSNILNPAEGIAHLERALSLYRELGDEQKIAEVNVSLGSVFTWFAPGINIPRALAHFREAQAWQGQWTDHRLFGLLHLGMSDGLFQALRTDEAVAASQRATQIFERDANPFWMSSASGHAQHLMVKGRHREAVSILRRVSGTMEEIADPEAFRSAMWSAGWYRMLMRDPVEARRLFVIGMERPGLAPHQRAIHSEFLALTELLAGDLSRAKALAAENRVNSIFLSRIAFREGHWERAREMLLASLDWSRRAGSRWIEADALSILFETLRVIGDFEGATEVLQQALSMYESSDLFWEMRNRPQAVLLAIETSRREEAIQHLEVCRTIIAQGEDWLGLAGYVAPAQGVLAAAQGGEFTTHFEKAVAIFKRYSLPWDEADTLHYWARTLKAAGEYGHANEKFDAAIELYRRHGGGQRWIDRVEAERETRSRQSIAQTENGSSDAIFRREGEFWTIVWHGKTSRLKDAKGLRYIAYLLAHPGNQIHVHDMITVVEGGAVDTQSHTAARADDLEIVRDLGGRDSALDWRARSEYGARLRELRTELDEADCFNDTGRSERLRAEIDLVSDELAAGLGRHASSDNAERARGMVSKRIRATLDKIHDEDPALGRHFAASIKTGYFCAYLPDPDHKIAGQM